MTREEYLETLTKLHRQANLADTDQRQPWQYATDAAEHCQRYEAIVKSMLTAEEYQAWLDNL